MYTIASADALWRCREKYPDVFLASFQTNALKPLGHATVVEHVMAMLGDAKAPLRLLEIGHGNFSPTFSVFHDHPDVELSGIDDYDVAETVEQSSLHSLRQLYPNARFYGGYIGADSKQHLPNDYFDIVYSVSVIEHLPADALDEFFAEISRILKPNGVHIHSYDRPWGGDVSTMAASIIRTGFTFLQKPRLFRFWKVDDVQLSNIVFEHPYVVLEHFSYAIPRNERKLHNWVTVIVKASKNSSIREHTKGPHSGFKRRLLKRFKTHDSR